MDHQFNGPPFTIGIEEELMILDADGLGLAQEIERVLDVLPAELEGQVKPELLQSVLEIATKPCEGVSEAGEELRALRRTVDGHRRRPRPAAWARQAPTRSPAGRSRRWSSAPATAS